jgi:hypothetical protein
LYQVDVPSVANALPTPAAAGAPGYFTDGNPGTGTPATILSADFMNMLMQELLNVLVAGGVTPSKTTYNQLSTAINNLIGSSAGTAVTAIAAGTGVSVARVGNTVTITNTGGSGGTATLTLNVPAFLTIDHPSVTGTGAFTIGLSGVALPVSSGGTGATSAQAALTALGGMGAAGQVKQTGITIGANATLYNTLTFTAPSAGRILAFGIVNSSAYANNTTNTLTINGTNMNFDVTGGANTEISSALVTAGSTNTIQQSVATNSAPPTSPISMQLAYVFVPAVA